MPKKSRMSLGTLNTILNTAPLIIQGATRLLKAIKEKNIIENKDMDIPDTLDGLKNELERVNRRLENTSNSTVEQIKLIEELARQNKMLAESVQKLNRKTNLLALFLIIVLITIIAWLFIF